MGKGTLAVSNFVRGEYIRGYVIGLMELYFVIKEEQSVENGIHLFNGEMGTRHPRKVANAFQSATSWLGSLEDAKDVEKTLRRLGEHIRATLILFDMTFIRRARDPLNCAIGVLSFPSVTYQENHLLDFYEEYQRIRDDPDCDQCEFRRKQQAKLSEAGIDLYSQIQQQKYEHCKGYVQQTNWIEKAVRSPKSKPTCWYCDRLGDTIIALSPPDGLTIVSGDSQSFPPLADILGKPLALIPSLNTLKAQRDQTTEHLGS